MYKITTNIAWQIAPTKSFVYICVIGTDTFYKLDGTGMEIWKLLMDNKSETDIVKILSQRYEMPSRIIENDVQDFIQELVSVNIIVKT